MRCETEMNKESKVVETADLVELAFLVGAAARLPEDADVLKALGDLYTRVGQYEKGLEVDRKLVRLCPPDPLVWYNLGCSLALLQRRAEALEALSRAVRLGYRDHKWMSEDDDLAALRDDRAFRELLNKITACHSGSD
jgi:Flp pilus assembly protein TadD